MKITRDGSKPPESDSIVRYDGRTKFKSILKFGGKMCTKSNEILKKLILWR